MLFRCPSVGADDICVDHPGLLRPGVVRRPVAGRRIDWDLTQAAAADEGPIPRKSQFELITQLVVQTGLGVWWLAGLHYQYLILGPGIAFLRFGPVWQTIYPLLVLMVIVDLGLTASRLIWPDLTP